MMYGIHRDIVLLFSVLICQLLKFLGLVFGKEPNSKSQLGMHGDIFSNQSASNPLCSGDYSEFVWVCSFPSHTDNLVNTKKHSRVLVFQFNDTVIKVFLSTHMINLPDANISLRTVINSDIPVYQEEISKNLYIFYEGILQFFNHSLPFSAEWNGFHFKGKTFYLRVYFEFFCANNSESNFYMTDLCFFCNATCTETNSIFSSNNMVKFHNDLLDAYYEFPELDYSQIVWSTKAQLYRSHRQAVTFSPTPLSCVLHLVADHLFYKHIGDGSVIKTINAMFSVVNDADALFRSTDFDGDLSGDNIGFIIGKVTVYPDSHDPSYNLSQSYFTAREYLKQFSYYDFSHYCLGIVFTYREFSGLAGSAFQAYSDGSLPGGICQKRLKHNFDFVSFNTALITFLNFGKKLEESQRILILAHELGHSFGASHDVTAECHPDSKDGNFLMSPMINFGALPNNPRFSACSIKSMLPVIKKKGSCLLSGDQVSQCGNTVPESGEECDCGTRSTCHLIDPCCTPADEKEGTDKPCTVRRSKEKLCSPKLNSCCAESCTYVPQSDHKLCNHLHDCSRTSVCDGLSGHCPFNGPLPDGTLCNNGYQVCEKGSCSQTVCEYHNLTSCVCTKMNSQCKLCCRDPTTLACEPAMIYGILSTRGEINQEPGEQCYKDGFCDLSLQCLIKSPIYGIQTHTVLGFKTKLELKSHINKYWLYYIFAAFCIIFTVSVLFIPFHLDDSRHMKALRYGKMMAVFATGEQQTQLHRKILVDIDDYYTKTILQLHWRCEPKDYIEAVGRLKLFFPEVHISYLSHVAKLSASERIAVKILLLQGFRMRTFTTTEVYGQ